MREDVYCFECNGEELIGIAHIPQSTAQTGVIIVVGGPQYRVGSHRQFVLLARHLADRGIAVFRFDYRGMGDSSGVQHNFKGVNDDIHSAVDVFSEIQKDLSKIYIWGLCDAASAALFYAHSDPRITGLILANPWARHEMGLARTQIKSYYAKQLINRNFWVRLLSGKLNVLNAAKSALGVLLSAMSMNKGGLSQDDSGVITDENYLQHMLAGAEKFQGNILLIISGQDLTAAEFVGMIDRDAHWKKRMERADVSWERFPEIDHTFSRDEWRERIADCTARWIEDN